MYSQTILRDIEWRITKSGKLFPVAIFDPVEMNDKSISACETNLKEIKQYQLGIDDTIGIVQSNDYFVRIVENCTNNGMVEIPKRCPYCKRLVATVNDYLECHSPNCHGMLAKKLANSLSVMGVKGLAENRIIKLLDTDRHTFKFRKIADFFNTRRNCTKIKRTFPGYGDSILESIEAAKDTTLVQFIQAYDLLGEKRARDISDHCNGDVDLFLLRCKKNYDWSVIPDINSFYSDKINSFVKKNISELIEFRRMLFFKNDVHDSESEFCFNKKFFITGEMKRFKNRNHILSYIENHGGMIFSCLTKSVDYAVTGELPNAKAIGIAKKYGVQIITEEQFIALCKGEKI